MKVRAHKIASVVYRLGFGKDVEITDSIEPRAGNTIVVRALHEKRVYREIELASGRMSTVFRGDVIVGALGRRRALRGFSGEVPRKLEAGDTVEILNRGGVIGASGSSHKDLGKPLSCEVLGMPVRDGRVVSLADATLPRVESLEGMQTPPVVVVSGTSMESGKTLFLAELIQELSRRGFCVGGGKLTGIACLRDLMALEDHGARRTASFLDAGHASTVGLDAGSLAAMTSSVIAHLSGGGVDLVLLELGDGILGEYGVLDILKDPGFRRVVRIHAFCASDMPGAWGAQRFLESQGVGIDLFSGPVTDNEVGVSYLEEQFGRPAINAYRDREALARVVLGLLGDPEPGRAADRTASGPKNRVSRD